MKIMAPRFVVAYRKSGKNDGNDAEVICEAALRPNMRCAGKERRAAGDPHAAVRPFRPQQFYARRPSARSVTDALNSQVRSSTARR
jgi:transposase